MQRLCPHAAGLDGDLLQVLGDTSCAKLFERGNMKRQRPS